MSNYFEEFAENAKSYSDRTAIVCGSSTITYGDLVSRAYTYGEKLSVVHARHNISTAEYDHKITNIPMTESDRMNNLIIPVTEPAGIEWFIQVLGIMAAGFAAVPISSVIPTERKEFILSDIGKTDTLDKDAALIYYTSGSTGTPKGVVLTHTGILAFSIMHGELFFRDNLHQENCLPQEATLLQEVSLPQEATLSQEISLLKKENSPQELHIQNAAVIADPSFDAFLLSTFPQLLYGITLYIAPDEVRASLVNLHKFLLKNKIDITFLSTQLALSYMRTFDNRTLKILLTGGEALRGYVPRSYRMYNLYGPCEGTVYVAMHQLTAIDTDNPTDIPIGKETGRNHILLIDDEIYITGSQLAAGYLNRPEETAERFIPNPYYKPDIEDPSYARMYKTGDRASYDENGELRFRGRTDKQVKISGYRIETDEIEAKIMSCVGIVGTKVSAVTDRNGETILQAICVGDTDEITLRRELQNKLPKAMIPAIIRFESEIKTDPRTGKGVTA
jgi:non-ribosomal peptide synthetase component F